MDFTLSDTEQALRDLTARILGDHTDVARRKAAEADARAGGPGVDAPLWSALTGAGLLAAFTDPIPAGTASAAEDCGRGGSDVSTDVTGSGAGAGAGNWGRGGSDVSTEVTGSDADGRPGVVAAALMAREVGATVAPVPLVSTLAALLAARDCAEPRVVAAVAAVGDGNGWAAVATPECGGATARWAPVRADGSDGADVVLDGEVGLVLDLPGAAWIVVEAVPFGATDPATYWVDASAPGVIIEPVVTTAGRPAGRLTLLAAPAVVLRAPTLRAATSGTEAGTAATAATTGSGAAAGTSGRAGLVLQALLCATQAGVCTSAIRDAGEYLGTRYQFGRPLASFQAPVHRLVDAHIDTDAIWLTALLAAWRLDQGLDAAAAVDVARWWAADAGNRAVHTVQHLHGGIGADVDYPVHRSFLWAKTIGDALGGGAAHLAHLGSLIAAGAPL